MSAFLQTVWTRAQAATAWVWSHRTKMMGVIGGAASYAFLNQDKLGLFIPAKDMGLTMGGIGFLTFAVGLYNSFLRKEEIPSTPSTNTTSP